MCVFISITFSHLTLQLSLSLHNPKTLFYGCNEILNFNLISFVIILKIMDMSDP